jgi:hypothetical protein
MLRYARERLREAFSLPPSPCRGEREIACPRRYLDDSGFSGKNSFPAMGAGHMSLSMLGVVLEKLKVLRSIVGFDSVERTPAMMDNLNSSEFFFHFVPLL